MKTKVSPAVVGLFVLGALTLAVIALLSFGGVNFFSQPERFIVYFDESVHGLDLGSPVKLRGVRVGRVVDLNLRYLPSAKKSVVAVVCELSRNQIADGKGQLIDVSDRKQLESLIDQGLRAQLGVIGLATGLLYVELDFYDPAFYPTTKSDALESRYAEMPAVPSAISEFQANLTEILNDVKKIDFQGLSREVQGLLADTRKQINALDAAGISAEWAGAGKAVRTLAESPGLKQTIDSLGQATTTLNNVLAKIDTQLGPDGARVGETLLQIKETLASFNSTATTAQRFISAQQTLGDDAAKAFVRLGEAASAVQQLADYLERNPNALITGRRTTPGAPANAPKSTDK